MKKAIARRQAWDAVQRKTASDRPEGRALGGVMAALGRTGIEVLSGEAVD